MLRTALGLVLSAAVAVSSTIAAGRVAARPSAAVAQAPVAALPVSGPASSVGVVGSAHPTGSSVDASIMRARVAAEAAGWRHEETSRVPG